MLSPMMQCAGRIRVKDCPFGAPDGTANQFQLVDRHGHAVTKDVRIASIHQTDWQGRVELSSEARTNLIYWSQDLSNPYWVKGGGASIGSTSQTIDGTTIPYWSLATDGANTYCYQYVRETFAPGDTVTATYVFRAGSLDNCRPSIYSLAEPSIWGDDSLSTARILSGPGTLTQNTGANWHLQGLSQTEDTVVAVTRKLTVVHTINQVRVYFYPGPPGNSLVGDVLVTAIGAWKNDSSHIAYIPTTDSPVTVTDYTDNNDGTITLGQAPQGESSPGAGDAAVLDWTGTARRAA